MLPPPQEPVPNDLKDHEAPAFKDPTASQSSKSADQSCHV